MTIIDPAERLDTEESASTDTSQTPDPVVVEVPVPVPTWAAGNAAWWAISVVVAALAIALFTLLRTASAFSEPVPAQAILEAVLLAPTRDSIDEARSAEPDAAVLEGRKDLVAFEVRADAPGGPSLEAIDQAVEDRATQLRTSGIPVDPGADRTQTGVPRQLIESLSAENHDVVERGVLLSAILAGALLLFTLLQGRNDNLLMLPAGALAVAWVLVTIAMQLLRMVLDGTGPGTAQVIRIVEAAAEQPRQQLTFAVVAAVLGGAMYRLLNQWQGWRRRRALERYRAAVAERESTEVVEDDEPEEAPADLIDVGAEEIVLSGGPRFEDPQVDGSADEADPARPIPVRVVRRRESTLTD